MDEIEKEKSHKRSEKKRGKAFSIFIILHRHEIFKYTQLPQPLLHLSHNLLRLLQNLLDNLLDLL
jgi:hypothetical protein